MTEHEPENPAAGTPPADAPDDAAAHVGEDAAPATPDPSPGDEAAPETVEKAAALEPAEPTPSPEEPQVVEKAAAVETAEPAGESEGGGEATAPPTDAEPAPGARPERPPPRPRRRRRTAAERHGAVFFARLTELRRAESGGASRGDGAPVESQPAPEGAVDDPGAGDEVAAAEPATEATPAEPAPTEATPAEPAPTEATAAEPAPTEATAAEPAATEATPADAAAPDAGSPGGEPAAPQGRVSNRARLIAAIGRVGGPEVVRGVLQPKRDGQGQPLKWAAACCQAAQGLKPGDPAFNAWVRLAATPVREIKAEVAEPRDERGGRSGRGGRRGGDRRDAPRGDRAGGRRDRDRPSAEDMAAHAQGGRVGPSVRITTSADDAERRERERQKKAEREAKRIAERERLRRIGY